MERRTPAIGEQLSSSELGELLDEFNGIVQVGLDLTKGYWQVPVRAEDQEKTATPFGLYHFKWVPFGLQGVPATFQRMVDQLLEGAEESQSRQGNASSEHPSVSTLVT